MRYDRGRGSLDRHATYIVATYLAGSIRSPNLTPGPQHPVARSAGSPPRQARAGRPSPGTLTTSTKTPANGKFLKERVCQGLCRPKADSIRAFRPVSSRREPVAGRVEVDPLEVSVTGEGGQGRAEARP